eukprot:9278079-Ditylum_brightwellii.AAC.1
MRNFMLVAAMTLLACGSGPTAHVFATTPTKSCCHPPVINSSTASRRASSTEVQQLLMKSFTTTLHMRSNSNKEQEDETILQMQRHENEEGERIRRKSWLCVQCCIQSTYQSLHMIDTEEIFQTEDITWSHALDLRIKERSKEAEDNLKFLEILGVPCEELVSLDPANFPSILPHL